MKIKIMSDEMRYGTMAAQINKRKKYIKPDIDILLLEEEDVGNIDSSNNVTYAARELNKYFFSDSVNAAGTTTITLQRAVNIKKGG